MATPSIKLRAKLADGETQVKALISHPMETGRRKDQGSGALIPAHFIRELTCKVNGTKALELEWNATASKDPYLAFALEGGAVGDEISVTWLDNLGNTETASVKTQ
jgi:sulfur-oxidizing protein SoxZ